MQSGFILPGFAQQPVTLAARRQRFGCFAQAPCFVGKALFEALRLFEAASMWHGVAAFRQWKAGAQPAFASQVEATGRAVTE